MQSMKFSYTTISAESCISFIDKKKYYIVETKFVKYVNWDFLT